MKHQTMKKIFFLFILFTHLNLYTEASEDFVEYKKKQKKRVETKKREQNIKILQNILQYKTQKNLYLSHEPQETKLMANKGEIIKFTINTNKINPNNKFEYVHYLRIPFINLVASLQYKFTDDKKNVFYSEKKDIFLDKGDFTIH